MLLVYHALQGNNMQTLIVPTLIATVLTTSAAAQLGDLADPADVRWLHNARSLNCEFEEFTNELIIDNVEWNDGGGNGQTDNNMGSARLIGNIGFSHLTAVRGFARSSFIEVTRHTR